MQRFQANAKGSRELASRWMRNSSVLSADRSSIRRRQRSCIGSSSTTPTDTRRTKCPEQKGATPTYHPTVGEFQGM
eukprot:s299_g17.t1